MSGCDKLRGVFAPIVTPFADEKILYDKLCENIERYNRTALLGYMPLGSNGEFQGLTPSEGLKILDLVNKHKAKDKVVVAGCGRESAYATVEFIKEAADHGLDMAFVLSPHYFVSRMTDEALFKYFTYVADKSPVPIVVYNAPKFSASLLISEELMAGFAYHPNIIAMKNSSLHPNYAYRAAIPEDVDFCLIAGNIKTFYPGLKDGAVGGVLSTASYMPEQCAKLYQHFVNGEFEEAEKLHEFLNKLSSDTIGRHGVAGVKVGMDLRGWFGGEVRIPLLNVSMEERERIAQYFDEVGIR